ncbi:TIGR00341 family protein [Dyella tabacisoli]|uniref:TIGR00341 family protein n=1 Tax=Dyella tabacisoli TaxID=2282381 RepID=A0A369UPM6_9GAMM|nr:TIGR00341 family protein [Dyella tabacisoli]RDD80289.1 TIGR00341 family protein [Dyella tabacisoli]
MFKLIRRWLIRQAASVDRDTIAKEIDDDGELEGSYLFMCAMASGIATIGLLCNSVSVIIGAMLVSPLMGPIVRLGLGIATLHIDRVFRSLGTLFAGMGLALLVSILIVWLSPLRTPTPEILARTTPNLFDMIAATLSGLAGGYAMIRKRGGTIVGVAIATALMPPMAVVGFGLAVGQWRISQGALLLFTTNLATIALSATLMSTWYGFSGRATRHAVAWQIVVGFAVLLPLGWPLAHALGDIAQQTRLLGTVRSTLTSTLSDQTVRVLDMQIDDSRKVLDVTFAAQHYDMKDDTNLHQALVSALPPNLSLRLNPVITVDPARAELTRSALSVGAQNAAASTTQNINDEAHDVVRNFPLPLLGSQIEAQDKIITLIIAPTATASLTTLKQMEDHLDAQLGGWKVHIVPPPRPLPPVLFGRASAELGDEQVATMQQVVWATRRWGVKQVLVEGRASSDGNGTASLASERASHVRDWLETAGLHASMGASYPLPDQAHVEEMNGIDVFRSVLIQVTDPAKTD